MAKKNETVIILDGDKKRQRRTKNRRTVTRTSTPLVHVFNDEALAAPVAVKIKDVVKDGIEKISTSASKATLTKREYSKRALRGSAPPSVVRRYSGKRGIQGPTSSLRLHNDSGILADGLHVKKGRNGVFTTNLPSNRGTFNGALETLINDVPVLRQPRKLLADRTVKAAIRKSIGSMVVKAPSIRAAKKTAAKQKKINAIRSVVDK